MADGRPESERLQQLLAEAACLTGSEARVLVALLRLRTGTLKQLSESTGISRSNIYPVIESLSAKGLCQRLVGKYAIWECPEPKEVIARLRSAEADRLEAAHDAAERRFEEADAMLAASGLGMPDSAPPVTVVNDPLLGVIYQEAMASVDSELLVLNRGPYPGDLDQPSPPVIDALARGVRARAIYQADEIAAPDGAVRNLANAYGLAGVEQRVIDRVPAAVAVIGKDLVLLSLPNSDPPPAEPFHDVAIRHERIAELASVAFERLWEQARPYDPCESNGPSAAAGVPTPSPTEVAPA